MLTKTNKELLAIYNDLKPSAPMKAWKGKKMVLIERIEALQAEQVKPKSKPAKAPTAQPVVSEKPKTKAPVAKKSEGPTIRDVAIKLLCETAYYEDGSKKASADNRGLDQGDKNARSVGWTYANIIEKIQDKFPDCKTTVACLRWYSVKIRVEEQGYEGLKLPQRRPRARPVIKG